MESYGDFIPKALEPLESAQTGGQAVEAIDIGTKSHRKGSCKACRSPLSEPDGQYAGGFEEKVFIEKEIRQTQRSKDPRHRAKTVGEEKRCQKAQKKLRNKAAGGQLKDPKGGLTLAGRKSFASKDGSHLRPGVTKKLAEMTLTDMRRKGSWAVRFYGRKKLPPLIDSKGKPTRYALSAHAWGEPVPRTAAAARRIAAKGERLLGRYQRLKRKR